MSGSEKTPAATDFPDANAADQSLHVTASRPIRSLDDGADGVRARDQQDVKQATTGPATQKTSGAGPSIAEHSKDATAPESGRQPGAYVED